MLYTFSDIWSRSSTQIKPFMHRASWHVPWIQPGSNPRVTMLAPTSSLPTKVSELGLCSNTKGPDPTCSTAGQVASIFLDIRCFDLYIFRFMLTHSSHPKENPFRFFLTKHLNIQNLLGNYLPWLFIYPPPHSSPKAFPHLSHLTSSP